MSPYGLSEEDVFGEESFPEPIGPGDDGGSEEPDPAPPAGTGCVIRAPRGPVAPADGYSVYAVVEEPDPETGEPEVVAGQVLATGIRQKFAGDGIAHGHSLHPDRFAVRATAVVCNDGRGRTLARYPVLRVA